MESEARSKELVSIPSFKHNLSVCNFVRTITSVLAGSSCGISGITGLTGFLLYFIFHIIASMMLLMKAGFNIRKYYGSWSIPLTSMVFTSSGLFSFLLFWIILYNVSHVF